MTYTARNMIFITDGGNGESKASHLLTIILLDHVTLYMYLGPKPSLI